MDGTAFNSEGVCGDHVVVLGVADNHREQFERWYVCCNMIATVHHMLIMLCCGFIKVNDFLGVDGKILEVGVERFFQCIMVNDAGVNLEEEADNFGILMAKIISFNEDAMFVEPVEKSDIFDSGVFEFRNQTGAAEDAANHKLVLESQVVGALV